MTRLIVWRHGQTIWNRENRIQGQTDVDLDEFGRSQAAAAAALLAAEPVEALFSSDLRRARDTAEALATLTGLPVTVDSRLREREYGDWEGLTHHEISTRWADGFQRWKAGDPVPECGLEDLDEVGKRVGAALLDAADHIGQGTVVVVSHGGAARHGIGTVLGWSGDVVRDLGPLGNCHWSELRRSPSGGRWRLHAHNVGPRTL